MRINDIIDLQETSPNHWRAKYQGNYGVYTIKIAYDSNGKTSNFSCSCPSDYYPCKHIGMVKDAISEHIAKSRDSVKVQGKMLTVEELLKEATLQELRNFVVRQAKYNPDLTNAVTLEFARKLTNANTNVYSAIIRKALKEVDFDYEDYCENEEGLELDVLDQWLEKAQTYVEQKNGTEAVLICKACIEEFAEWQQTTDEEIWDYVDADYQSRPFKIMEKAVANSDVDSKELYAYCLSEMGKDKYSETNMFNKFNDLLSILAVRENPGEFIALQEKLLKQIDDKSSRDAEKILQREINFYNKIQQPDKANALIEKNLQIDNFRYQVAEKRFAERNFSEAKKLIKDYLLNGKNHYNERWNELLLKIAQKEKDIPSIRSIAFAFIEQYFDKQYFAVYKSTFTPDEWNDALEHLLQHYQKNSRDFRSSVADVLVAEKSAERLMQYIEKNISIERLVQYHSAFAASYPEKTLELFRKKIDEYTANHIGRNHYECIAGLLEQMRKIKSGDKTVAEMIARYRTEYKNRRVMLEILNTI